MDHQASRRQLIAAGVAGLLAHAAASPGLTFAVDEAAGSEAAAPTRRRFLTDAKDFDDVSRGEPIPHTLKGEALVHARLTEETWRLQIIAQDAAQIQKPVTLENGSAIDFPSLVKLGEASPLRYFKAMQCNNIPRPLGQGLWEGVALRDVLKHFCGEINNVRRIFYWGFHNDDPKQMFRSSLPLNQVLDTPPGEMPPMIAYRLNGAPIPLQRGGPVRMIVPWAHGFKSIKWLQNIVLTNHFDANDTYAEQNNDPESYLKTAAYFDSDKSETFAGQAVRVTGTAMVGWPGLERVDYWLRANPKPVANLAPEDPAWDTAQWLPAAIDPPPAKWKDELPPGTKVESIWGFTKEGRPRQWPMRYSLANWSITRRDLKPGTYELRVRTVDQNGFAQPEPRPGRTSGKNQVHCKILEIAG